MASLFKFKVGQVVFDLTNRVYIRISAKHREDGQTFYTLAFQGDEDYDYLEEDELRRLTVREQGKV